MRILIVSEDVPHPSMGGLGKHAVALARALGEAGHQVDFMGSHLYEDQRRHLVSQLGLPGAFFPDLYWFLWGWKEQRSGIFNPLRRPVQAREFARLILRRARDYDVVHYHGHLPDVASYIPSSVNFVQTRHDQGSDCLTHTRFRNGVVCTAVDPEQCAGCATASPTALQTMLSAMAVRQFRARVAAGFQRHKAVFVSDMLRRNFARSHGSSSWGVVVHNFTDRRALDNSIGSPHPDRNQIEVFVAGKLYPPKGIGVFLERLVPRLPPHMTVRVAGNGPDQQRLRSLYEGPRVRIVGWQTYEDTISMARQADAIVVPSVCEESCATTVLEGLALGKTLFALHLGGTPELARYARPPAELRLYPDMDELVAGVASMPVPSRTRGGGPDADFLGDVKFRLPEILAVYRATPAEWGLMCSSQAAHRAEKIRPGWCSAN